MQSYAQLGSFSSAQLVLAESHFEDSIDSLMVSS